MEYDVAISAKASIFSSHSEVSTLRSAAISFIDERDTKGCYTSEDMDGQPSIKKLKTFSKNIDWNNEQKRQELFHYFYSLIGRWRGEIPDLRQTFTPQEMDWLLTEDVKKSSTQKMHLVHFVIRTGYTDKLCGEGDRSGHDRPSSPRRSTALHHAAKCNMSCSVVGKLFELYDRFDANYVDEETGLTHLHVACKFGLFDRAKTFVERGHDPGCLTRPAAGFCFSSFQVACLAGHLEVAEAAIEDGQKPDDLPYEVAAHPPLQLAAAFDRVQLVRRLMKAGANPNLTRPDGKTTLHVVCETDNAFCMTELLLKLCGDRGTRLQIDRRDNDGRTPLLVALAKKNWVVAKLLVSQGADLRKADIEGFAPLHMIGRSRASGGLVTILYNHHREWPLEIDALTENRETPLHLAASNANNELMEFLLRNGADPNSVDKAGSTPLHLICKKSSGDARRFFKIAKEMNLTVRVDVRDSRGRTALEYAVAYFFRSSASALLANGAKMSLDYFPDEEFFGERFDSEPVGDRYSYRLKLTTEALALTDYLERHCERTLRPSHGATITNFLDRHGMFETPPVLRRHWYKNRVFQNKAKKMNMKRGETEISFYDLVQLSIDETMKHELLAKWCCEALLNLVRMIDFGSFPDQQRMGCIVHLWKIAMRHYYERWAPVLVPTVDRLPDGFLTTAHYVVILYFKVKYLPSVVSPFHCVIQMKTNPFKGFDDAGESSFTSKGADFENSQMDRELYSKYDYIDDADIWTCEDNDFYGQVNFDKLKSLRKDVDFEDDQERYRFYEKFTKLISEWKGKLPNLRDVFRSEEIEALLVAAVTNRGKTMNNYRGKLFIRFVKNSGYKDDPKLDKDGKPLSDRATPLHLAGRCCRNPKWKGVFRDYLFEMYGRFDVNYVDPESGLTHFHVACKTGCLEIVRKFLELGQDPNCLARETCDTPLHFALDRGHGDIVRLLLEHGAEVNFPNIAGMTPLHVVCKRGYEFDMAGQFFEICDDAKRWVRVHAQDQLGRTPLQWAVANCSPSAVKVLLERGAGESFVFPDLKLFERRVKSHHPGTWADSRLKLAASAMMVVEHLENGGCELDLQEAVFIMTYFDKFGLLACSPFVPNTMVTETDFANRTKTMKLNPSLSVYDLIQMPQQEAVKRLTYADCLKFSCDYPAWELPLVYSRYITVHLFEIMTKGYFQKWATQAHAEMNATAPTTHNHYTPAMDTRKNIDMYSIAKTALKCIGYECQTTGAYDFAALQSDMLSSAVDELLAEQQAMQPLVPFSMADMAELTYDNFPGVSPGELLF
ncbi:unnamed protein product [Trichogramma brassicae]|uniref:Uncharacterized protein n=1 Tax=Trichogramma brassicae TaxID=86971 RepID=A0A6H5IA63_9HYME|nr:unnamed protein product [Trichogramma brassicae]